MSRAEQERREVGLTPEEVRGINALEPKKDMTRRDLVKKAANVLAASLTAAAGTGLAATAQEALNSAPAPVIQEQKPDTKRDNPPPGVVFHQDTGRKDGGAVPILTKRGFLPRVTREFREPEPPLYLREFGAPERGVIMRNKVEQGGGNPAYVEMGDQELFNNMLYLRETYGRPDLKLEITFYSTWELLRRNIPYNEQRSEIMWWDLWAGSRGTFKERGESRSVYREQNKTLEFHISLPETKLGKIPMENELNQIHADFVRYLRGNIFFAREDGRSNLSLEQWNDLTVYQDLVNHPVVMQDGPRRVTNSSIWIKLEIAPTIGGK